MGSSSWNRCAALAAAIFSFGAIALAQQDPQFVPWPYDAATGRLTWERHQFSEDNADTVFSLARELVTVTEQAQGRPDVLLFAIAQFDPPDGVPSPGGPRHLLRESIEHKGLQLYVNYAGAKIDDDPLHPQVYPEPQFFIALDGAFINRQPQTALKPPVIAAGLSSQRVSATRGAFGCYGSTVPAYAIAPLWHENPNPGYPIDALYVTAGVGYGRNDVVEQSLWDEACRDRFLVQNANQTWRDEGLRIPAIAKDLNSSGVCFADFNGDGWMDLFVGLHGDNYVGDQNRLLLRNAATGNFDDVTATKVPAISDATVDVAAADLNGDGFPDIVVANRANRLGAAGAEAEDYVLLNNGQARFTKIPLATPPVYSDTRSVAVGALDYTGSPVIVLGNAGSDGYQNTLTIPASEDEKIQIFRRTTTTPLRFVDDTDAFIHPGIEREWTGPLTQQVVIADLFGDPGGAGNMYHPDGRPDLVIVNHRDILKNTSGAGTFSGRITVLVRPQSTTSRALVDFSALQTQWASNTVAIADFSDSFLADPGTLDLLCAGGNRFGGWDCRYYENLGHQGIAPQVPWNFNGGYIALLSYDPIPGNERGYGFDFGDFNGDGALDALQTSRAYDYYVDGINTPSAHVDWHKNLTSSASPTPLDNRRGRLKPQGMEDGVFADFDGDGDLEALMASQIYASGSSPGGAAASESSDTILLRNTTGSGPFIHEAVQLPDSSGTGTITFDKFIDLGTRNGVPRPSIADRAVAGDLDNDGDVDAIMHLFGILNPGGGTPSLPLIQASNGFPLPKGRYSYGWRYLKNIFDPLQPTGFWLQDMTGRRMLDQVNGSISAKWNRTLGLDLLADFDGNGALDLFTTNGSDGTVGPGGEFEVVEQAWDLLFLNGIGGAPVGTLIDSTLNRIPQMFSTNPAHAGMQKHAGSFGAAMGDIDNDGDQDLVVTHGGHYELTSQPSLLVNRMNEASNNFTDEFLTRVPTDPAVLSTQIHSARDPANSARILDDACFPVLVDFDADGDLDLVYQVKEDLPRLFRNRGADNNGDGLIDAADLSRLGWFEDATDVGILRVKPTTDAQDLAAIDPDHDGDYDLAVDPFDDEVQLWRNDLVVDTTRAAVTEIWPRIGAIHGKTVTLEGARLDNVQQVELRFAGGATANCTSLTPIDANHLKVSLPTVSPVGLAQVRVLRLDPITLTLSWSIQYFGYFVLG